MKIKDLFNNNSMLILKANGDEFYFMVENSNLFLIKDNHFEPINSQIKNIKGYEFVFECKGLFCSVCMINKIDNIRDFIKEFDIPFFILDLNKSINENKLSIDICEKSIEDFKEKINIHQNRILKLQEFIKELPMEFV